VILYHHSAYSLLFFLLLFPIEQKRINKVGLKRIYSPMPNALQESFSFLIFYQRVGKQAERFPKVAK
jgi:hypothetical protein